MPADSRLRFNDPELTRRAKFAPLRVYIRVPDILKTSLRLAFSQKYLWYLVFKFPESHIRMQQRWRCNWTPAFCSPFARLFWLMLYYDSLHCTYYSVCLVIILNFPLTASKPTHVLDHITHLLVNIGLSFLYSNRNAGYFGNLTSYPTLSPTLSNFILFV